MDKPNLNAYFNAAKLAVADGIVFQQFRSHPAIRGVTDTNTLEHGLECEREIMENHRHLLPWLDTFRKVDAIGMPPLYNFPHVGLFNPTTLRHIVTLSRIQKWFSEPIQSVWEIGGSYGLLAALIIMTNPIERYFIYEDKRVGKLSAFFIRMLGLDSPCCWFEPGITPTFSPDIVISCYALSELDRTEQDWYIENVLVKARAGFLVMNSCNNGYHRLGMIDQLESVLETKVHCEKEIPLTHKDNYTLMWKRGNDGK